MHTRSAEDLVQIQTPIADARLPTVILYSLKDKEDVEIRPIHVDFENLRISFLGDV